MIANEQIILDGASSFMTVRHLTLRGTNFEIGQQLGELAISRYQQSVAHYTANPVFARARRIYFQRNYPIFWERVRGVATAFGVDPEDDHYDFTGLEYNFELPQPVPGCSVVYYPPATTASGSGYLSRNYDFSTGTPADLMQIPVPPAVNAQLPPIMSHPYIMAWHPTDGGYASLAIHAFDLLSGTLDGMNSAGLVVSIMADEEAMAELGPNLEMHMGAPQIVGLHELQVMRLLLDTCATVAEAKLALLTVKQYYGSIPCHYIVADKAGNSFVFENSTGRNVQHVIEGNGHPQAVTNFQLYKHPTLAQMPDGELTMETNAFWRYRQLVERIEQHQGPFTLDDLKANNACVSVSKMFETMTKEAQAYRSIAADVQARTLWHSIYDQESRTAVFSFYLSDEEQAERRSAYLKFELDE